MTITRTTQQQNATGVDIRAHINMDATLGGTTLPEFTKAGAYVQGPKGSAANPNIDLKQTTKADARFSDIHCHPMDYTGKGVGLSRMVKAAQENGINRFTVIPIPTNIISPMSDTQRAAANACKHSCGEHYYVPNAINNAGLRLTPKQVKDLQERSELYVNTGIDDILANQVHDALRDGEIEPKHLDMMDLALTGVHLGDMHSVNHMLKKLAHIANLDASLKANPKLAAEMKGRTLNFTHVGEVTVHKELVEGLFAGKAQANLKTNIEPTRQAMRMAGVIGMPWILHCDVDTPEDLKSSKEKGKPPKHLEDIKALLRSCPNTDIIWAHAGGLGRFVRAGEGHVNALRELMEDPTLSHVKLDISWSQVADQLTNPRDFEAWATFLVDYKDRIIFGSDTLTPQTDAKWTETYDIYNKPVDIGGGEQVSLIQAMHRIEQDRLKAVNAERKAMGQEPIEIAPHETAEYKIMLGNYDDVMLPARERVNAFSKHVLPQVIDGARNIAGPVIAGDIVQGIQELRDQTFAQKVGTEPSLQGIIDHYAARDESLLDYTHPEKDRKHKAVKSLFNAATFGKTFKSYKTGAGGEGDRNLSRESKQTVAAFARELQELQAKVDGLNGDDKEAMTRRMTALRRELGLLSRNVGTSNAPNAAAFEAFRGKVQSAVNELKPLTATPADA